ncbi:50S ribosomal protein L19 [Candidatus Karelsulcia muelleri]
MKNINLNINININKYLSVKSVKYKKQYVFKAGDTVNVDYEIKEGDKKRIQSFKGIIIKKQANSTFTIRKFSGTIGVERIFPINSPIIKNIKIISSGKVRRSKIYYLRNLRGKQAKIKSI